MVVAVSVLLNGLPALAIVELHPVVLPILHLAGGLESPCEQVPKIIVVRGVLEAEVANISQILVEFIFANVSGAWRCA